MSASKTPIRKPPVIRDKEFAKRLETACENNSHCPTIGRGKQKWIYDNLRERFGISASPEAARKWFAGEAWPRQRVMQAWADMCDQMKG